MALFRNSVIVAGWTAVSRGLGFARDLLIANKLGAGLAADAFFIALMLPNLLRRLFAEGAFNVAFVPIVARHKAKSDEAALVFASAAFSWLLVIVTSVVAVGWLAMPGLVAILASGWLDDPAKFALAVELGRITFPYLGLITVASFLGAMCNTWGKFAAYAMVPALLNLSILVCLFALPEGGMPPVFAAAWAVPIGGVLQVAYMAWSARQLGLRFQLSWLPKHPDLKKLLLRMGPALLGVGVLQLSIIIDNAVASWLPSGAVSYLQYANRFYQLPLALIGIAVATVLLPHLATLLGRDDKVAATQSFTAALGACLALAIGSMVGLVLLAPGMMHALLGHGEMTYLATQAIAWGMIGYVVGLPGYILTKVTAPAFFAAEDPLSPVKASAVGLAVNLLCNVVFVTALVQLGQAQWAHVGIALATAVGGYVNAALQWHWLRRKGVLAIDARRFWRDLGKMSMVAGAMGAVLVAWLVGLPYPETASLMPRLLWLATAMGLGGSVFLLGLQLSGVVQVKTLLRALRSRPKVKLKTGPETLD